MEASIEHLSRGTVRYADILLAVLEPYYRSLETTGRIAVLAPQLGIPRFAAIANKIRSAADEQAVRTYCGQRGIDLIAMVPFDDRVVAADGEGVPFLDYAPDSSVVAAITNLAAKLEQTAGAQETSVITAAKSQAG